MISRCKLLGLLTPYQAETLKKLQDLAKAHPSEFWRPRDVGAFRNSHHTKTLMNLEKEGWVEKTCLSSGTTRPTYGYRISAAGRNMLEVFRTIADVPLESVFGRAADRRCASMAKQLSMA